MSERRYLIQPLIAMMGDSFEAGMRRLKISGRQYQKYRDEGMSRDSADRFAVRAGFHPYEVWPEMADHDLEDQSKECGAADCTERFIPRRRDQMYCSKRCKGRVADQRYRRNHPERAEKDRAKAAAYYSEFGDYVRARQRRYDRAKRQEKREEAA